MATQQPPNRANLFNLEFCLAHSVGCIFTETVIKKKTDFEGWLPVRFETVGGVADTALLSI